VPIFVSLCVFFLQQISKHFQKVIATDVSAEQLKYAEQRPNITYAVTPATLSKEELTRIVGPEGSVDLVLIVEALHWFDFDQFYHNVKHVLRKPGGVIAATVYPSRPKVEAAVDQVTDEFYATIEHYWDPRMLEYVDSGYRTIPFPFAPVPVVEKNGRPQFEVTVDANLDEFLAYLESWSAVQTAVDHGEEPLSAHMRKLFADAWGPPETVRCLKWPLDVFLGTV